MAVRRTANELSGGRGALRQRAGISLGTWFAAYERLPLSTMITLSAHLLDGSVVTSTVGEEFVSKFRELQAKGLEGMALIHELFPDDLGTSLVRISAFDHLQDGTQVGPWIPNL
jgi:hypothetical protein